jgi:hypothetical protein
MRPKKDFVLFDATDYIMNMSLWIDSDQSRDIDLGVDWLKAICTRDYVYVSYSETV